MMRAGHQRIFIFALIVFPPLISCTDRTDECRSTIAVQTSKTSKSNVPTKQAHDYEGLTITAEPNPEYGGFHLKPDADRAQYLYETGKKFEMGFEVRRDLDMAKKCYYLAVELGSIDATHALQRLEPGAGVN